MKIKWLFVILLLIILVGCVKPVKNTPDQNNQNNVDSKKTCSGLSGYKCTNNEECKGNLLSAADTNNCCSIKCTPKSSEVPSDVELPKFDFGKSDGDNALGSLK